MSSRKLSGGRSSADSSRMRPMAGSSLTSAMVAAHLTLGLRAWLMRLSTWTETLFEPSFTRALMAASDSCSFCSAKR